MEQIEKVTSDLRDFFVNADFKNFTSDELESILKKSFLAAESLDMIARACRYYMNIQKQN